MPTGAITGYIDVAQLTLYAFWIFFAGVIYYCHREDKREGYPLETERLDHRVTVQGFPPIPAPKRFILPHGGMEERPRIERPVAAVPSAPWPGAPLVPTGNPMIDGVGAAAYAERTDEPDLGFDDRKPKIVPLRVTPSFFLATEDPDPRGMAVIGADKRIAGFVVDAWVDRSETIIRYLEVEVPTASGARRVLLPMTFARIKGWPRREVRVVSILAAQFADVPGLRDPDQVTLREEDRIMAYYGGGHLYATPARLGPVL